MAKFRGLVAFLAITALAALTTSPAAADAVSDFYTDRPVTLSAGYSAGGGFDLSARTHDRQSPRQAHPGAAPGHRAEHAWRRQHAGGEPSLQRRTQGRHRARAGAGPGHRAIGRRRRRGVRGDKVHLAWEWSERPHR